MHDMEAIRQMKQYMAREGLNQTDLSIRLGVATSQLNRWLKTERIGKAWIALLKEKKIIEGNIESKK